MCEVGRLFGGYFRRTKLSGRAINTTQATENRALLQPGEETVWKSACGVLHLWVALPVLLLSVAHSDLFLLTLFPFSHLAAVAHKTLPVKGSAPDVAQVRPRGAGGWSLRKDPSRLCCVTTGGNWSPQAEEPTARLSCFGKAGIAVHSSAFRKGLLCLVLQKHNTL